MRNLKPILFTAALLATLSLAAVAQTKSLYERLGGKESITAVVDDFAGRVLADTRINAKFAKSDPVRLKAQLVDQICAATGGPCQYTGRTMEATHTNMGVTNGEFGALVEDLTATLDKFNVPAAEKDELIKLLAPMKPQIVEVQSDATGTALPKKYKAFNASGKGGGKVKASKGKKVKEEAGTATEPAATTEPAAGKTKGKGKKVKEEATTTTEPAATADAAAEKNKGKGKKSKKAGEAEAAAPQEPAAEPEADKKSKKKTKSN